MESPERPPSSEKSLLASLTPRLKSTKEGKRRLRACLDDEHNEALAIMVAKHEALASLLAGIAEASPFLWRLVQRDSVMVMRLLEAPYRHSLGAIITAMAGAANLPDEASIMRTLRRLRSEAALLIAIADLGQAIDVVDVIAALSDVADAAVRAGLRFLLRQAVTAGQIDPPDESHPEQKLGLFVLALGKHGARELNYSSDIDLAVFYEPSAAGLASAADPDKLAVALIKALARMLNERTADGYVQRVDLRLRPDPGTTPIAMPVEAALHYYETVGQNWERAAMIKARVVAGDEIEGARFLKDLAPFIWRKYFDYAAIADIHAMKRQIYAVKGHGEIAVAGHDLKLGRGGIREIEFFVQTQQLVYGGRRPSLRGARTLDMLKALADEGWVTAEAVRDLTAAYCALRSFEHRIQMIHDEQTQRLPKTDEELTSFAGFCGFTRAGFAKALVHWLKLVERHYARLFEAVPGLASISGSLVFTGVEDDPETLQTLKRMGFKQPAIVAETVRGWHFGRRPAVATARARELITELVPGLLEAFGQSSDPDGALLAFDRALERMPAANELFSILKNNTDLRRVFAEALGTAPRLSQIVAQSPHVLDTLVDPDFARGSLSGAMARLSPRLAREHDFEMFLIRARELARAERFLLGTQVLSGVIPLHQAGAAHTDLAEALLGIVLERVQAEFAIRHGHMPGGSFVLAGFGKAGSREMTANSDLDLVAIYNAPDDAISDGEKPFYASEYYAKLMQRMIAALSAPMRAGVLFEIDVRLRPSGKKGPLAASLAAFSDYQAEEAESWEHLALSRARVLAGDAGLAEKVHAVLAKVLASPREAIMLRKDVAEMRGMMNQEKPGRDAFDVKDWPGGLIDIEFISQTLALLHARDVPAMLPSETDGRLNEAARAGHLEVGDAEALRESYAMQSSLMQAMRLFLPEGARIEETSANFKNRVAKLLDYPDFATLQADLAARQKQTRRLFERLIGPVIKPR